MLTHGLAGRFYQNYVVDTRNWLPGRKVLIALPLCLLRASVQRIELLTGNERVDTVIRVPVIARPPADRVDRQTMFRANTPTRAHGAWFFLSFVLYVVFIDFSFVCSCPENILPILLSCQKHPR